MASGESAKQWHRSTSSGVQGIVENGPGLAHLYGARKTNYPEKIIMKKSKVPNQRWIGFILLPSLEQYKGTVKTLSPKQCGGSRV